MFDIGFMELVLISIVALLVVGPEKLPGAIRTGALWVGRAKRSFNQVKADIEREINADEIRRQLHNESILADIEKAKQGADKLIADTQKDLDSLNGEVNTTLGKEKEELEKALQEPKPAPKPGPQPEQKPAATPDLKHEANAPEEQTPAAEAASVESAQTPAESGAPLNPTVAPQPQPVEDFYNNPPAGIIRLQGGVFQQVVADEEESDQEPQRKS